MSWDSFVSSTRDAVVDLGKAYISRPDAPVAADQNGNEYVEGQPSSVASGGIKPVYLIGGGIAIVALFGLMLALRR